MKASVRNLPALAVSLGLHALLLVPLASGMLGKPPSPLSLLPDSVAFEGNSVEVEAPAEALGATGSEQREFPVEAEARTAPAAEAEPAPQAEAEPEVPAEAPPKPKRQQPRAKPAPKPAEAAAAPSMNGAVSGAGSAPEPNARGTFGAEGLAPGVRRLGYAFSRAIPAATPADEAWKELPAGLVGTIRVELTVDADGRLGEVTALRPRPGEPATPPALERMAQRTALLLRAGQFALSSSNQPGKEVLVIEVRLSDQAPDEAPSGVVVQKKFEGATPARPGSAYFRYDTGRVFEAKITIAPARG